MRDLPVDVDDGVRWGVGGDVAAVADEKGGRARVHLLALDHTTLQQVPVVVTGTGVYLWSLLDEGPQSVADLVARAVADFPGTDTEDLRADVAAFVAGLVERGILVAEQSPGLTPED